MNKDQFWETIDNINQSEPFESDAEYKECVLRAFESYSMDDILDWQSIMTLYDKAADRRLLYEKFKERTPRFPRVGFDTFQSWLISRGKETYFDVLRNPERVKSISEFTALDQWKGRYLFSVSHEIYYEKHKLTTDGEPGYLSTDICRHPLSEQTRKDIQEELLREAPLPTPPIIESPQSPASSSELIHSGNYLYGYVEFPFESQTYVFFNTPGNIAHFLGNHGLADHVYIDDANGDWVLEADGWHIWNCRDEQFRAEIEKTLAPIQWGEVKPEPFFCPAYEEVKPYLVQRAGINEKQGSKDRQKEPGR